jgi:alkanesulfonate monooxygenase SsuD/methylene tetrahydromethanopterin reductase-like flavin-dependent oxidoreductase (luciferase family)
MAPMIPLMAKAASGVGFALTMSTTYHHPFYVARFFNALDHVTRGRIAWNAVTSAYKNEAANYGFDTMMDHDERYERAQEFLEVTCAWDSVEPDALVLDRERGSTPTPRKFIASIFAALFPSAVAPALPSPRGGGDNQAGLSGPGMTLAATYADLNSARGVRCRHATASQGTRRQARIGWSQAAPHRHSLVDPHQVAESETDALEMERRYLSRPPGSGPVEMSAQYGVVLDRDARHAAR